MTDDERSGYTQIIQSAIDELRVARAMAVFQDDAAAAWSFGQQIEALTAELTTRADGKAQPT